MIGEPIRQMDEFTLRNASGMTVRFIAYGGSVVSIEVPDRDGRLADVTLGYDDLEGYENDRRYVGALIGRYANRIAKGHFTLDGRAHAVTVNDGVNHLHGGRRGFHKVPWNVTPFEDGDVTGAVLSYTSVTGDEGYPGTLSVSVIMSLTPENELVFDYAAVADEPTPVNLTHHGYFNLAGHDSGDVRAQELMIAAPRFTPVDAGLIPTGKLRDVTGTPFDFRQARRIGDALETFDDQLRLGGGFDHNFVLDARDRSGEPMFAARLRDPASGRTLEILTTEPGLQFYSGQALGGVVGKGGHVYCANAGVALETQHFPDSPNRPSFPSTILRPDEGFTSRTVYRFSAL
ncbi:MAG TPA: aldose epimerase family protein [Gemmatimonadaceae bacterium]|nr:aldose epimerase family protein [Gemmatimonadaceae bacterium]